ncbi:hypothetical protein BSKO_12589 [Bryopsis sp. KO-2023]|nr:hypothetical protein BSKO_12589 [Bryopsis sp. KO-2023]
MSDQLAPTERHKFTHEGRVIYEWDQTLSEVNLYIEVPPGVGGRELFCDISRTHLRVGMKPNPPYLDQDFHAPVKPSDCFWTLEDGVLHITLQKFDEADPWPSALKGHDLAISKAEDDKKRLLLERFQQEHPGFDFSGADVTGSEVPNARTFMRDLEKE